jgi:hypothetical protein
VMLRKMRDDCRERFASEPKGRATAIIQGASSLDVAELRPARFLPPAGKTHRLKSVLPVFATSVHPPQADSARDKSGNAARVMQKIGGRLRNPYYD